MIRFDSAPELTGVLVVGTKVHLQWNLKMRANITLYQRYETPVGAYSKFIDQICSNVKKTVDWVVPRHLSGKSDLFLCLHPTNGNLNTTSQCFAVASSEEETPGQHLSLVGNRKKGRKGFAKTKSKNQHPRLPREKLIGRRAPSWIVSRGKNAFHRKDTISSFQSVLPLLKDGKPVTGGYYHTIGKTGYFECKILDCEPFSAELSIGLAGENFPTVHKLVGDTDDSYGYSSNTGSVLTNNDHPTRKSAQTFGSGDTVGCGIHIESGDVFFTLNGILVSVAFPGNLRYSKTETVYPTVSGMGRAEIQFIFGNEKFKFQQFAEVARLCERQHRRRRSWGIDDVSVGVGISNVEAKKEHKRKSLIFKGKKSRRHSVESVLGRHSRSSGHSRGSDTKSLAVDQTVVHNQSKVEPKIMKAAPPAAPVAPQTKPHPAPNNVFLMKARKNATIKRNRKTACFHHTGLEHPTRENGVRRWILKKKGRRTGTLVTRYFYIEKGDFVYYSSLDSSSAIGRINFLGAKIKVKSTTMLEIECRSRSDPVYIDGFGAISAMRVKEILNKVQSELENIDVASTATGNNVSANASEELEKLDKVEKNMSKNTKEEVETNVCVNESAITVEPATISVKNTPKDNPASIVKSSTKTGGNHIETNILEVDKTVDVQATVAKQKRNLSLIEISLPTWTNDEVLEWLRELRYDQYVSKFRELLIDGELLLEMTDEDLKNDLNISIRLHRVKLLKSIKKMLKAQEAKGVLIASEAQREQSDSSRSNMTEGSLGYPRELSSSSDKSRGGTNSFADLNSLQIDVTDEYVDYGTIAAIFANPLVIVQNGKITPMPLLDWETERNLLCRSLREAGGLAKLTFSHATTDVLRTIITKGCRVLHYSGHGNSKFLSFEDGAGLFHPLENERLKHLFAAGAGDSAAGNPKPKLVFVSACSSRKAGEAFLEAGAEHIVCVETLSEIEDRAAQAFTRAFYCALVRGYYVQDAFQIGQAAVETCPMVGRGVASNAAKEASKFVLLPLTTSEEDDRHRVSLFPQNSKNELVEWIEPPPLSYEILPALTDGFVGRQLDIFNIVSTLIKRSRRIVSVVGEKGIGKSAIVKQAMHYLADRGCFVDGILYVHVAKNASIKMIADALSSAHEERSFRKSHPRPPTPSERHLFVNTSETVKQATTVERPKRRTTKFGDFDDKNTFESMTSHICRILHSSECLVVLDDLEASCEIWPLVSRILKSCHKVRFLLTCISPLSSLLKTESGIHDYPEHVIRIGNLNLNETARMIRSRVPRADVRIDKLLSEYSSELQAVSTPMKVLEVAQKLISMTLCKEAFDLN